MFILIPSTIRLNTHVQPSERGQKTAATCRMSQGYASIIIWYAGQRLPADVPPKQHLKHFSSQTFLMGLLES